MPAIVEISAFPIESKDEASTRLRELLAERMAVTPEEIRIALRPDGKPGLSRRPGDPDLRFNLSHSGNLGVVALAEGVELGIDVEQVTERRPPAYLRDWTRHEAYVKGLGVGIRQRPGDPAPGWRIIDLELVPGYVAALAANSEVDVRVRFDPALAERGQRRGSDAEVLDREPG
jgi:4'-phosphopantetheinyl transferase